MTFLAEFLNNLILTFRDVLPIVLLFGFFQLVILKQPIADPRRMILGTGYVIFGLTLFLVGLEKALFPLGKVMAIAYDSGGVTTSTVTVPIVAALGLGLSAAVPGRNPAIDGFGLIAFVLPVETVIGLESQMARFKQEVKDHYF